MNKDKQVFDKEHITKPVIYLRGIGRYCQAKGCNKHLFGKSTQKFCSNKCRWKTNGTINSYKNISGIQSFVDLRTHGIKKPYRIIKLYLKKGIIEEIRITPESKELWNVLNKIAEYRLQPMVVVQ